jgi:hypothetical protein
LVKIQNSSRVRYLWRYQCMDMTIWRIASRQWFWKERERGEFLRNSEQNWGAKQAQRPWAKHEQEFF